MTGRHWFSDDLALYHDDCLRVLAVLRDSSVDSIVTDPPYDLTARKKGGTGKASENLKSPAGRSRITTGFMGKSWDGTGIAFDPETWRLVYRVLKPGGYLIAFGGTRTYHRLVCAIEDAGFEIRDSLHWIYGSGFPKSLDVSKAIDKAAGAERTEVTGVKPGHEDFISRTDDYSAGGRSDGWERPWRSDQNAVLRSHQQFAPATDAAKQWEGWGTALKPAHEPIVLARKPLTGTVAANVLDYGTGALNVEGCRVTFTSECDKESAKPGGRPTSLPGALAGKAQRWNTETESSTTAQTTVTSASQTKTGRASTAAGIPRPEFTPKQSDAGRWPPNVILMHSQECVDGSDCASDCPVAEMDRQSGKSTSRTHADSGGPSRYFPVFIYQAKAPKKERPVIIGPDGKRISHPTCKPLTLMRWLVRLVTPPGGVVLDLFAGTGTTGQAARLEGMRAILVESLDTDEHPYVRMTLKRLGLDDRHS